MVVGPLFLLSLFESEGPFKDELDSDDLFLGDSECGAVEGYECGFIQGRSYYYRPGCSLNESFDGVSVVVSCLKDGVTTSVAFQRGKFK
jgi:hypothetical protein